MDLMASRFADLRGHEMCNPALFMLGASFLGGAMQGQAQREYGEQEASVAKQNAMIAEAQGEQAKFIGGIEEQRVLQNVRRTLGAQRTGFAAANVDPASGSALDIQLETAQQGAMDATIARANAMRQAWGFGTEAQQQREAGRFARRAGVMRQRATLLTTASDAYRSYAGG
jgi:hypothetical protein